jgi:two-component system, cell cycle sensor histidine kinase and response regulator CckA
MPRTPVPRAVDDGFKSSASAESSSPRLRTPPLARAARSLEEYAAEKDGLLSRVVWRLAGVGSVLFDAAGEVYAWDEQARRLFGLDAAFDATSTLLDELIHTDDLERVRAAIRVACSGVGPAPAIEFRAYRRSDGELRHFNLSAEQNPIDGVGLIAVLKDVSDRAEAEAALAETEARFRSLATNPYDYIALVDREGRFRYVNHVAPGLTFEGVLGHRVHEFVAPEFHPALERTLATVFEKGESTYYESYSPATGGWFSTIAGPLFDGDEVVMASLQTHDITEGRKASIELQRTARHLKEAQRIAGFGSWLWETPSDTVEWSEQMYRITGVDPQVRPTRELWESLVHPEDREIVQAAERKTLATGVAQQVDYRIIRGSDRAIRRVRTSGEVLRDDAGETVGFLGTTLDVTELRELEEQLLHSQKLEAMGRLAGSVAHDFNNLLVVIGFNTELLLRVGDPRVTGCVQEIAEAASRASGLTRQLLTFARRQVIRPELFDPDELLLDLEPLVERLVGKEVQLVLRLAANGSWIRIDRSQFEQVVLNLAANARDAMPSGGRLSISSGPVEVEGERRYQLSVADTGHGMDAATLSRAFEPFFTTKPPGQGTGIGLATCHGIVKQLSGAIDVESTVGAGTRFLVTLPSVEAPSGARQRGDEHLPRGNETVLVVESDPQVRRACLRALRSLGYGTLSAATIVQALVALDDSAHAIDLILGDSAISIDPARRIHERLCARPEIRVIYTVDHADDDASAPGAAGALLKPFSAEDLAHAVRAALDVNSPRNSR